MDKLHKNLGIKKNAALSYCYNKPESEAFLHFWEALKEYFTPFSEQYS